jgi:hypothetical protein
MAILSANVAKLYDARISKAFYQDLVQHSEEYSKWCEVMGSKNQYEKVALFGELPMPGVVGEHEDAPETSFKAGPERTWTHVKYGFTLIASQESIEDERFPVIVDTAKSMGTAMRHRIETQGAYDLNNAFTASTVGASDTASETLIATSHATFTGAGGAAQANRPSTDVTLGADSLWAGVDNFQGLKDHEGNPVMAIPKLLIIPPALERTAIEILKSVEVPYKSTNEINAIKTRGLDYVVGHYLTSSTAWYLVTDKKPIRFYMRRAPQVKPEDLIRSDSRTWTITARMSHGPYDWYQIYGTDGAA